MTKDFIALVLIAIFSWWCYSAHIEITTEKEQHREDIAEHQAIIVQKNKEINDLEYKVNVLQNTIDELECRVEEQEVSRGTGRKFMCETSAYTVGDDLTPSSVTASGTIPVAGRTVACSWLPIGTRVLIDGNVYIVEDVCGTDAIDIYMDSYDECMSWGRRTVEVEIL